MKLVAIERDSYFWLKPTVMLMFNFDFENCQKLCPRLQKPPLPSKIPGYAPLLSYMIKILNPNSRGVPFSHDLVISV